MKKISFLELEDAYKKGWCVLWRLGSKERPASPEEIVQFQQVLSQAIAGKMDIVWNHDIDFILFNPNAKHIVEDKQC